MMDPNFIQNLRMRQLFPVGGIPDYSAPPSPQPIAPIDNTGVNVQQPFDVASRMSELYTPETQATDQFNSLAANPPQYENPSFLRTIGAALSAFGPGGHKTGNEVMNWHNTQNQNDWTRQLEPAQKAADNERQSNANERVLAHTTVSNELKARADADKNKQNETMNKIRADRAKVYEFKAKNPTMRMVSPKGGNIVFVNPQDPTKVITLTDDDGKPISSGMLSETDKINLQHENAMEKQDDQQAGAASLEATKQSGRTDIAETRGWELGSIPDPNEPTKQIGVRINQITGETVPIQGGVFTKAGTPSTTKGPTANDPARLQLVQDKARETKTVIDELIDKDGNLTDLGKWGIGGNRMLGSHKIPGTKAYKADTAINNLKSRLVIGLIEEMKSQSRTGATGFGAMNIKELGILEAAIGQLDPNMPEDDFARELVKIRDKMNKILQPTDSSTDTSTAKPPGKRTPQQMWEQYNKPGGV